MINVLKKVLYIWLIKYWFVVILSFVVGGATTLIIYNINKDKHDYSADLVGCTLVLDYNSLFMYIQPLIENIENERYDEAAAVLGLKADDVKKFKSLGIKSVSKIAEESEVRYEFNLTMKIEGDTTGLHKFETAFLYWLKKHQLLISLQKSSEDIYLESKIVMEKELFRLDSTLLTLKKEDISNRELLHKRKSEIELQLVNLKAIKNKIYDVKIVQYLKHFLVEEKTSPTRYKILWLQFSLLGSLLIVFIINKEIKKILF